LPGDINGREIAILVPLALIVVYLGVYPSGVLRSMNDPFDRMRQPIDTASAHVIHVVPHVALVKPEETLVMKP